MSALTHYWEAGGPLMAPLALLSFASWYWVLILAWRLRRARASATDVQERLRDADLETLPLAIEKWASEHPGPVARVARHAAGGGLDVEAIRSRCAEARLAEVPRFGVELAVLKAMVAAAPLLGLLGTVRGMVETFTVLATRGTASVPLLSSGISEALVTTQVGLVIALPGIAGAYAISRRLAALQVSLDIVESQLVAVVSRSRGTPAETGAAA